VGAGRANMVDVLYIIIWSRIMKPVVIVLHGGEGDEGERCWEQT
jgi:hypothetical protein